MIERLAVAWARDVDPDGRAQRGARTGTERDNAISQVNPFIGIIGDEHDGLLVFLPDAGDFVLQRRARERVQRAERFVEQKDLQVHRQGAGHADALAHPAGQFARPLFARRRQVHQRDVSFDMLLLLCRRPVREKLLHREVDVFVSRQPREQ